jgi:glycine hydroxymethyltransferase
MTTNAEPITAAPLSKSDPEIARYIAEEVQRQEDQLEMIASENFTSRAVLEAMGTVLTNKYAEGYPGKRYYGGCEFVDKVEQLAIDRAKALFGAEHANVQPHSGSTANQGVYFTACKPGDTVLGMSLAHGGHLTHGHPVNFSGMLYKIVSYGVSSDTGFIDYDALEKVAKEVRPKLIVTGASAYPRKIDFERVGRVAKEVGALHMSDIAHYAGLVAAGLYPNPVPHADFVTSTTHKTLRGPRAGLILCKAEYAKGIDKSIFPGLQGGPLEHIIAGKAVCFGQAMTPEFKAYQQCVLENARTLAETLVARGHDLVSGGTDCHLVLVDLKAKPVTGKDAEKALEHAGITANKNAVPNDPRPPAVTSGVRLGTPALTTRGMGVAELKKIGGWIADVLDAPADEARIKTIRAEVKELCAAFPLYGPGGAVAL